jgi:hypothetical protein
MKVGARTFKSFFIPMAVGAIAFAAAGTVSTLAAQAAEPEMKVDVTITDKGYDVKGHTTPGALTAIVVRNKGTMTHGINSPLFKEGVVKKEGAGTEVAGKGKGVKAYHLEPGQTMTLHFKKGSATDPATGISETTQVPFWCDIHPHMRGEFLVVETKGEIGGG